MTHIRTRLLPVSAALISAFAGSAGAQQAAEQTLAPVVIREAPSVAEKNQLPATTESVTRAQINDTVNVLNTEDAFKYLPNVLIRKRHIGDTQSPMTTRTSGVGASARSLIYADGMLLTPLIANDNNFGGPKFGMVTPEEIERIDVMYGPFSAAYAGNSIGAVAEITTRMPKAFEATARVAQNWQSFSQYNTSDVYASQQVTALLGNKVGDLSFWLSANHLDSHSQPLTYVTVPRRPNGAGTAVSGAVADANRNGNLTFVIGETGIERHLQDNYKIKVAYDISPTLRATYTGGAFLNNTTSTVRSYLNSAGATFFGNGTVINQGGFSSANAALTANATVAANAFSSGVYKFREDHTMHSFSLKSDTKGPWDWEFAAMRYEYGKSERRTPTGAMPAAVIGGAGTIQEMKGTAWGSADLKATWRPQGMGGAHQVSFGAHYDRAILDQPLWNTADWVTGGTTTLNSDARGKTETRAVWVQDVWKFAPKWKATIGARFESWRAFDGRNFQAAPALNVSQPGLSSSPVSPKLSLAWEAAPDWIVTGSLGRAYRFPTVKELYQSVTTGATLSSPNPNLLPENALSHELAFEHLWRDGRFRVSVFGESIANALISQTALLSGASVSFVQNIDQVRSKGIEAVFQQDNVLVRGLELSGSVTYVDARVVRDLVYPTVVGKYVPQVPNWRATAVATYRPNDQLAATLAVRYQGRMFGSIENWDGYGNTYQGFEGFFVADARLRYKVDKNWTAAVGIDNLNNHKYFLFHPFPQRSLTAELKYTY